MIVPLATTLIVMAIIEGFIGLVFTIGIMAKKITTDVPARLVVFVAAYLLFSAVTKILAAVEICARG